MNTNNDLRLAMCESALTLLNDGAMYTTKDALKRKMKQAFPTDNETQQRIYIKTALQDLLDGSFIREEGSLVKITDKGREAMSDGGYTKSTKKKQDSHKQKDKNERLSLYINIVALIVAIISEIANLSISESGKHLSLIASSVIGFIAGALSTLLLTSLKRMQKQADI